MKASFGLSSGFATVVIALAVQSAVAEDATTKVIVLDQSGTPAPESDLDFGVPYDFSQIDLPLEHIEEIERLMHLVGRVPKYVEGVKLDYIQVGFGRGYGDGRVLLDVSDKDARQLVAYLRRLYPYESLRTRLAYESSLPKTRLRPRLTERARSRLAEHDLPRGFVASRQAFGDGLRARSLAMLHSKNVRQFITQEGFGVSRFAPPGPLYLRLAEETSDCSQVESVGEWHGTPGPVQQLISAEPSNYVLLGRKWQDISNRHSSLEWYEIKNRAFDSWQREHNPWRMPIAQHLTEMHDESWQAFASRHRNGHAKDVDHVAGFASHAIAKRPVAERFWGPRPKDERIWQVRHVELVSLLKFAEPRVYVSRDLPKMEELRTTATRELTKYESSALQQLRSGKDTATDSRLNHIRMLGAIRAGERCLNCHRVHHGELLGAFSYGLFRKTPLTAKALLARKESPESK